MLGVAEEYVPRPVCISTAEEDSGSAWEHVVRKSSSDLDVIQSEDLFATLRPFSSMWNGALGDITAVKHHIPTEGPPVSSQPYRVSPQAREDINNELQRMLKEDVIEPSTSPWASPIVLIAKQDGSIRFAVDYRKLNRVTMKDSYALPRLDDSINSLGESKFFSTLDANSGFWQVRVAEEDSAKTAFTSHRGLYQFKRMPFGLVSAPATFQRAVDCILSSVRFRCAITYLDDIIVYSRTFKGHLEDLKVVLSLLKDAGVSLKLKKCSLTATQVEYLGFKVGRDGLSVNPEKIYAVLKAKIPESKSEIRSFLGMAWVYRRFVPNYSKRAAPLTKLLRNEAPEKFTLNES